VNRRSEAELVAQESVIFRNSERLAKKLNSSRGFPGKKRRSKSYFVIEKLFAIEGLFAEKDPKGAEKKCGAEEQSERARFGSG
jgi:hypothetical protein